MLSAETCRQEGTAWGRAWRLGDNLAFLRSGKRKYVGWSCMNRGRVKGVEAGGGRWARFCRNEGLC